MNCIPLRYQSTEYDCGIVAVTNAINYIAEFSKIPASFLNVIHSICLNECDSNGDIGKEGTSPAAMEYLASWVNRYSGKTGFPLHCKVYKTGGVTFLNSSELLQELRKPNTAIVLYVLLYDEHWLTLTDADEACIYLFDSYFWNKGYGDNRIVYLDQPCKANRKIPIDYLETTKDKYYSIRGIDIENRLAVVFSYD